MNILATISTSNIWDLKKTSNFSKILGKLFPQLVFSTKILNKFPFLYIIPIQKHFNGKLFLSKQLIIYNIYKIFLFKWKIHRKKRKFPFIFTLNRQLLHIRICLCVYTDTLLYAAKNKWNKVATNKQINTCQM